MLCISFSPDPYYRVRCALRTASRVLRSPDQLNGGTSMSLSDLASLGSFVSGFAVLISLIYLSIQVRQTKRNQQVAIRHSRASRIVELQLTLADPGVADAWLHGSGNPQEITQTELGQFINLCRALFFHFEDSFYQREEGLLNDDAFDTVVFGARLSARSPGWRAAWRIARPNFGGRFRDFMDGVVAASAAEPPVDLSLEAWQAAFAAESSQTT
jgi:hypothetical protein